MARKYIADIIEGSFPTKFGCFSLLSGAPELLTTWAHRGSAEFDANAREKARGVITTVFQDGASFYCTNGETGKQSTYTAPIEVRGGNTAAKAREWFIELARVRALNLKWES